MHLRQQGHWTALFPKGGVEVEWDGYRSGSLWAVNVAVTFRRYSYAPGGKTTDEDEGESMVAVLKEGVPPPGIKATERRQNQLLRERFEAACKLLQPVLSRPGQQNGTGFFKAMSRLQVTYPDLSASEIEALVSAVVRTLENRQAQGPRR
jgi:hypothetical protein